MIYHTRDNSSEIIERMRSYEVIKNNKKIEYINIPISFDIETSSFEDYEGNKAAIMYVWMVCIDGEFIIGRNWGEFIGLCNDLSKYLDLHTDKRIIIYVHNLSYEFQFIRKYFNWVSVFALDTRKPVYALTDIGIEFRCSYLLSGYSLEKLAERMIDNSIKKLVGNLNYKLIRHEKTPLTDDEIAYCLNDVLIVVNFIRERIEKDGDITKIPLTKTGYVRQFCRRNCLGTSKHRDYNYSRFIRSLTLSYDEYSQLKRAFQGGYTHANPFYSGKVLSNVDSFDFTSSYPSVMIAEKYPMSKSQEYMPKDVDDFYRTLSLYSVLFDVCIEGLQSTIYTDSYISASRCWGVINAVVQNGRIVSADKLYTTMTELDFFIVAAMYQWDGLSIAHLRRYMRTYLPTEFITSILSLYEDKTKLKGVEGKEYQYSRSKEMLNSAYGMIVTDICKDDITYIDDEWDLTIKDKETTIAKYNNNRGRFLYYPWGVWVTAYSRRNLFTGILDCDSDYVYSDTDSIKILNGNLHKGYIEKYNDDVTLKLLTAIKYHGLDESLIAPKSSKGVVKPLGVWDYEGRYNKFKTLGAKRYLVDKEGDLILTVSGLNKQVAIEYLKSKYLDVFEAFNDDLYIPKGHTGKLTHTYIDDVRAGMIEDYTGQLSSYKELSSVHLDDADYSLKISHQYADYLMGIQDVKVG